MIQAVIVQDASDDVYQNISILRQEMLYPTPLDTRYWSGGVYGMVNVSTIKETHTNDESSYLLLLKSIDDLVAYSRFSLNITDEISISSDYQHINNAIVHIIAAKSYVRGRNHMVTYGETKYEGKIGNIVYRIIFDFCKSHSARSLVADICVYPIPNLASLRLHHKLGFEPASNEPYTIEKEVDQHVYKVGFLRFGVHL